MVCGHCGSRENLSVVQEFSSSISLSQAISLENTPAEIRKELERALSGKPDPLSNSESKSVNPVFLIQKFANEKGIIDVNGIIENLVLTGLSAQQSESQVSDWLHQSEIEGMVIRLSSGEFRLL